MIKKYDICVIGAGAAGITIASALAMLGFNTVLVEKNKMGGGSMHYGCVPSKTLLSSAKIATRIKQADAWGIKTQTPEVDFAAVMARVKDVVKSLNETNTAERLEGLGVHVVEGTAYFTDEDTLAFEDQELKIKAKKFVIATGSRPYLPTISGLETSGYMTNENIFSLEKRPEHLLIIGGGPIGVEMAQAFIRLGSKVTLVTNKPLLTHEDPEMVDVLRAQLLKDGVVLHENTTISAVEGEAPKISLKIESENPDPEANEPVKNTLSGSHLLVATGRYANIANLGLKKAGIEYTAKGIKTDKRMRTTKPHIYAVGDCTNAPNYTHIANYHAGMVIKNIAFRLPVKADYKALPRVIYTAPELAFAGLSEQQAHEKYDKGITVLRVPFCENHRAVTENTPKGGIKVIVRRGKILGAAIAGENAGELIQPWVLAIENGLSIGKMAGTIAPYPTYSEINKKVAASYFLPGLMSDFAKKISRFLFQF